ncbi:MAG: hypothetical protein ACOX37_05730 [Bacillota bacterium]
MAIAGFTPGEADRLRRVMSHSRSRREMEELGRFFVSRAVARGMELSLAEEIFRQIAGYASYGFCEAHAAAFAETSYKTAYLACHYPAEYFAALLSHQPMGYYGARTLGVEARRRGISFLPPDINKSGAGFTVEGGAIRISLRQVRGMSDEVLARILEKRPYRSWWEFCRQVNVPRHLLRNLILSGAFDSLYPNRKQLLWQVPFLSKGLLVNGPQLPDLEDFSEEEKRRQELEVLGMEIGQHEMAPWRERLQQAGFVDSRSLKKLEDGSSVKIVGLPVRPHRPPTRSGKIVVFFSLEDEKGLADVTVFPDVYHQYGQFIFGRRPDLLAVQGRLQKKGRSSGIIAAKIAPLEEALSWERDLDQKKM